jgi:hypothetical protein
VKKRGVLKYKLWSRQAVFSEPINKAGPLLREKVTEIMANGVGMKNSNEHIWKVASLVVNLIQRDSTFKAVRGLCS